MLLHLIVIAQYFNSQPHEEADTAFDSASVDLSCISTHSLTKRLTVSVSSFDFRLIISTHSLTKRLTEDGIYSITLEAFQLTASRRG